MILIAAATSNLMAADFGIAASTLWSSEQSFGDLDGWGLFAFIHLMERISVRLDYRHFSGEGRTVYWLDYPSLAKSTAARSNDSKISNRYDSFDAHMIANVWDEPAFSFGFGPGFSLNRIDMSDNGRAVTRPGLSFALNAAATPVRRLPLRIDASCRLKHILGDDMLHIKSRDWFSGGVGMIEIGVGLAYTL